MPNRVTLVLVLLLAVAACGQGPATEETDAVGDPDEEDVAVAGMGVTAVTTVYPLGALAADVAPGADVRLLTSSGQDPHDLELSPDDRRLIESADVVLYLGDIDFQPQVESAVADATGQVVSVADVAGPSRLRVLGGDGAAHEDGHDEEHGDEDEHASEGVDPHMWFDAGLMAEVADTIGEAFAAADPDRARVYRDNAAVLHDELAALGDEIDELLSDCRHDTAIVSHEAYAYLLAPRGLEQEGVSGAGGHSNASPTRLVELTERLRAEGIDAVLAEPVEGRADAEALAREAGVDLLEIDPLEVGHEGLAGVRFPEALRAQAGTFATALGCVAADDDG